MDKPSDPSPPVSTSLPPPALQPAPYLASSSIPFFFQEKAHRDLRRHLGHVPCPPYTQGLEDGYVLGLRVGRREALARQHWPLDLGELNLYGPGAVSAYLVSQIDTAVDEDGEYDLDEYYHWSDSEDFEDEEYQLLTEQESARANDQGVRGASDEGPLDPKGVEKAELGEGYKLAKSPPVPHVSRTCEEVQGRARGGDIDAVGEVDAVERAVEGLKLEVEVENDASSTRAQSGR